MPSYMLSENVERTELNIVVLGAFNPLIITPFWLSAKGLIRESDAKNATVKIIHEEIVDYDLEWATFNITQRRFQLICNKEPFFEIVRDLVAGIFSILKETPIRSLGFNHNSIFTLKSSERYYEFGNKLTPLNNWSSFLNDPRLQKLEILEKNPKEKPEGSILVTVYAVGDDDTNFGVGININDHYNFSIEKEGVKFKATYIMDYWPTTISIASNILDKLSISLDL